VGFIHYYMIFNGLLARFGRFNPFLEDLGPFLRPYLGGSWEFVAKFKLYKPEVIEAKVGGSDQENVDELLRQNHFYAGKLLRSVPLKGHFWELRSSVFSAVSFDGFLRSRRTQLDHFCNPLALL
jgi:hypothetical protein